MLKRLICGQRRMLGTRTPSFANRLVLPLLLSEADKNPQNGSKQSDLFKILVNENPEELIRRYQSGAFTMNEQCTVNYVKALEKVGKLDQISAKLHSGIAAGNEGTSLRGGSANPMVMRISDDSFERFFASKAKEEMYKSFWKLVLFGATLYLVKDVVDSMRPFSDPGIGNLADNRNGDSSVTFDNVQGCEEAKEELQEIVDFLKDPERFRALDAKLPRGVLLTGEPGTGKTLLAKAVAGEAKVPFIFVSGSEFDEMFVGVGARRVREIFRNAKNMAPCIIFIDEIDAVAGKRSARDQMHSRQSLNQILAEMDGFKSSDNIIVLAATNLPDALDPAIMRSGRFDKKIAVPLPDLQGRKAILSLYLEKAPLAKDVDITRIAIGTPGKSGADINNLVNQAKILAAREGSKLLSQRHLDVAMEELDLGRERKSAIISREIMELTAFHEGGHVIVSMFTRGSKPINKATIVPRGNALGYVAKFPEEDKNMTKEKLLADLDCCMGGRIAEELVYGPDNVTPGAISDFQQATRIARRMVTHFGMSDKVGFIHVSGDPNDPVSETSKTLIDEEVSKILAESRIRVTKLLLDHRKELDKVASALLEKKTMSRVELEAVLSHKPPFRPFPQPQFQ